MIDQIQDYEEVFELKSVADRRVVLVRHKKTGQFFVYKVIQREVDAYREIATLECPGLPQISEVKIENGCTFVLEEYIVGRNLADEIETEGGMDEAKVCSILKQLCTTLKYLHGKDIIHRDIKPSNIILMENQNVRLVDFDTARLIKEEEGNDTRYLGTKGYAPPEQYGFAQTDSRTDIYALGVTGKELLGSEYNGNLLRVLDKCTAIDPKKRYQSVLEVEREINHVLHPAKRRVLWTVVAAAVVTIALVCTFGVTHWFDRLNADKNILDPSDIEISYAVNDSDEEIENQYFKEGTGELIFNWDEPLDRDRYDGLVENIKYITYTNPRSHIIFRIKNNGDVSLRNAKLQLDFDGVTLQSSSSTDYDLEYTNHVQGIGDYAAVIWKATENIRPGETVRVVIPMYSGAVIAQSPSVTISFMGDSLKKESFTVPIDLIDYEEAFGSFDSNQDEADVKSFIVENYQLNELIANCLGTTPETLQAQVGKLEEWGSYEGAFCYTIGQVGTKERVMFYFDENNLCFGCGMSAENAIVGLDQTLEVEQMDKLMGLKADVAEDEENEGVYYLRYENAVGSRRLLVMMDCDAQGRVSPASAIDFILNES